MEITGWMWTDAKNLVRCPRCHVTAGEYCRRPSGRKAWPPHKERIDRLIDECPEAVEAARREI